VLAALRARHPRVEVEVVVENRLADIVAEGYDAGVCLHEAIERDMVQVRLTEQGLGLAYVSGPLRLFIEAVKEFVTKAP